MAGRKTTIRATPASTTMMIGLSTSAVSAVARAAPSPEPSRASPAVGTTTRRSMRTLRA